jgi:hypothetical protein
MQELETSSIRNKQRTKLITIKETKLDCIREIEQKINNMHATKVVLLGKHQRERGTYGSPLPPREGS